MSKGELERIQARFEARNSGNGQRHSHTNYRANHEWFKQNVEEDMGALLLHITEQDKTIADLRRICQEAQDLVAQLIEELGLI